jgi:epoxyqueuosine reductase
MSGVRGQQGRFREVQLTGPAAGEVERLAMTAGFHRAAFVIPRRLAPWAAKVREARGAQHLRPGFRDELEWEWVLEPGPWSRDRSILVCCLSCFRNEPADPCVPGDPCALIAPFARAHYYRAAADLLRRVARDLESSAGIPARTVRLFSNSRLPEKTLLAASGMGAYGRNGLVIVPGLGSQFIIAGMVLPFTHAGEPDTPEPPVDFCGSCRACRAACPTAALEEPFLPDRSRCLQALATETEPFSSEIREAWGARLYGCQECQDCCPWNNRLSEKPPAAPGEISPGISLRAFLGASDEQRARLLQGTALGMSWIPRRALLRNALIAAGNRQNSSLRSVIEPHAISDDALLRDAALWALSRLPRGG